MGLVDSCRVVSVVMFSSLQSIKLLRMRLVLGDCVFVLRRLRRAKEVAGSEGSGRRAKEVAGSEDSGRRAEGIAGSEGSGRCAEEVAGSEGSGR